MDKAMAFKLLGACNLSYFIHAAQTDISPGPEADALIAALGTQREAIQVSVHGANLIDACLFAKTGDGDGILAFRGTLPPAAAKGTIDDLFAVARDWLQDAEAALVADPDFGGKVHFGFRHALEGMWDDIKTFIRGSGVKNLYVTGHSKGGSLAHLAAYRLARTVMPVTEVYSFAAARAGDAAFVSAFNTMIPQCWRFEYQDDAVPHLPPSTLGWLDHLNLYRSENPGHRIGQGEAADWFEDLLTRLETMRGYESAGTLQFIDWETQPNLRSDSFLLSARRNLSLAELLIELMIPKIASDHSSTGGYHAGVSGS